MVSAVRAGLAVTALARCAVPDDLRILRPEDGFPTLSTYPIGVIKKSDGRTAAIDSFAAHVLRCFEDGTIGD